MALTVEDGTGVANADSYITLAEARTYAASRGLTLAVADADAEIQLRKGFDYIEQQRFTGVRTDPAQPNQWPRNEVYIEGLLLSNTLVPPAIQKAQVVLAAAVQAGLDLQPNSTGASFVTREKVGAIETEYSERIATAGVPVIRAADALLSPFLSRTGALSTVRV